MTARRFAVCAVLAALGVAGMSGTAFAHAELERSNPTDQAVLPVSPKTVDLHFGSAVETALSSIRVVDADGHRVDASDPFHPGGRTHDVDVTLRPSLPAGTYLVSWRVVSDDSHPVSGDFVFSVGRPGAVPKAGGEGGSTAVGLLSGEARFGGFVGLALLLGTVVFLVACWPQGWTDRRARWLLGVGWWTAAVSTVTGLLVQGPYGAGLGLSSIADGATLEETLRTRFGHAYVLRVWLLLGFAAVVVGYLRRRTPAKRPRASAPVPSAPPLLVAAGVATGLGLLATVAMSGHADDGPHRVLALPVDVLHLAAMVAWMGGLVALVVCLLAWRRDTTPLETALPRFSRLAATSVGVLVATGTFAAWRDLGAWGALTGTPQGRLLLVKLSVLAVLLLAAAGSRRWLRSRRGDAARAPWNDVRALRVSIGAETAMAVSLLAVTAVLVATPPGRTEWRPPSSFELATGPVQLRVSVVPTGPNQLNVSATALTVGGAPTDVPKLVATADLPGQHITGVPVAFVNVGTGRYQAKGVTLPASGRWTLDIQVHPDAVHVFGARAQITVR